MLFSLQKILIFIIAIHTVYYTAKKLPKLCQLHWLLPCSCTARRLAHTYYMYIQELLVNNPQISRAGEKIAFCISAWVVVVHSQLFWGAPGAEIMCTRQTWFICNLFARLAAAFTSISNEHELLAHWGEDHEIWAGKQQFELEPNSNTNTQLQKSHFEIEVP